MCGTVSNPTILHLLNNSNNALNIQQINYRNLIPQF